MKKKISENFIFENFCLVPFDRRNFFRIQIRIRLSYGR